MLAVVIYKQKYEELSKLLKFLIPFGIIRFKPYVIHSASDVFQQDIDEIIERFEGARNSRGDIIIWESTLNQLNIHTK